MRCGKLINPSTGARCRREATHIGRFFRLLYCDRHKANSPNWIPLDTEKGQRLLAEKVRKELAK